MFCDLTGYEGQRFRVVDRSAVGSPGLFLLTRPYALYYASGPATESLSGPNLSQSTWRTESEDGPGVCAEDPPRTRKCFEKWDGTNPQPSEHPPGDYWVDFRKPSTQGLGRICTTAMAEMPIHSLHASYSPRRAVVCPLHPMPVESDAHCRGAVPLSSPAIECSALRILRSAAQHEIAVRHYRWHYLIATTPRLPSVRMSNNYPNENPQISTSNHVFP
ncbi:hypothetical protein F4802DRAFT_390868 [Xylaria palmicola]|nr:hypothetical protein F4802DRAFT_390868 [Xylaria palmicola]